MRVRSRKRFESAGIRLGKDVRCSRVTTWRRAARALTVQTLAARRSGGLSRWAEILPVRCAANVVFLGEGGTPLIAVPTLGQALGAPRLALRAEGLNLTGSFKARGMAVAASRARELGARSLVAPSAGNAGGALAAYGAAAGSEVTVVMPVDVPAASRDEALVCGARVLLVEGLISDCGRVAATVARLTGAFDVATLREPYPVEARRRWVSSSPRISAGAYPMSSSTPPVAGPV